MAQAIDGTTQQLPHKYFSQVTNISHHFVAELEGLQTCNLVEQVIQRRLIGGGPSGAFEENYNTAFTNTGQLKEKIENWQGSALIGTSRKYKVSSKLKGSIILLYDFLHSQHQPSKDPIKLRLGYYF